MTLQPYFAYGSNMDAALLMTRLGHRQGGRIVRRRGILRDHSLCFSKRSSSDHRIGYASVAPETGKTVEGVLADLEEAELRRLDEIELVPVHYVRRTVQVLDVAQGRSVEATCYFGNAELTVLGLLPTAEYIARLLGGRDILSEDYVRMLSGIPTI